MNAPNPMILHRKELLISEGSDYFQEWALLTKQLVALGVFKEPTDRCQKDLVKDFTR